MRLDASSHDTWKKFMFPCDCDDHHWLHVSWWADDDEKWEGYLEVTPTLWPKPSLFSRIKAAVGTLLMRKQYFGGVILTKESTEELIEILTEYLDNENKRMAKGDNV